MSDHLKPIPWNMLIDAAEEKQKRANNVHHYLYLYNNAEDFVFTKASEDLLQYNNKQYKYCVVDNSEWWNNWAQYPKDVQNHLTTFDLTLITGGKSRWHGLKIRPNYFWAVPYTLPYYLYNNIGSIRPNSPTKLFTTLNFKKKDHRDFLIDFLAKYDLIEKNYVSYKQMVPPWHAHLRFDDFEYFDGRELILQESYRILESFSGPDFFKIPEHAYEDSLFSIVAETTHDRLWITEKTIIPIFHKRPFIILGTQGISRYIKSLGFRIFENAIDYSFDFEPDIKKRTEMLVQELVRLSKIDIKKLSKLTQSDVHHNFHHIKRHYYRGEPSLKDMPFVHWHDKYKQRIKHIENYNRIFK